MIINQEISNSSTVKRIYVEIPEQDETLEVILFHLDKTYSIRHYKGAEVVYELLCLFDSKAVTMIAEALLLERTGEEIKLEFSL